MANSELKFMIDGSAKQIEDVIDARKKTGQYDVNSRSAVVSLASSKNSLFRSAYSTPATGIGDDGRRPLNDGAVWVTQGCNSYVGDVEVANIGPTDSEITVVRIKREGLQYRSRENKWNLHDDAVPGDGTHLGESPSLVNLVTVVEQPLHGLGSCSDKADEYKEYLVPLSSWDPCDNPHRLYDLHPSLNGGAASLGRKLHVIKSPRRCDRQQGLAGKITSFLRRRCMRKSKTYSDMGEAVSESLRPKN